MQGTNLEKAKWIQKDIVTSDITEKSDFVISSYMLNEIKEEKKELVIEKLWQAANKFLFIIEPGTPENYKSIMKYRDYLISNNASIIAPCPHQNKCELPENDWCHFICRVERTKVHKNIKNADSPFEDEKYIYLLASKEKIEGTTNRVLRHPKILKGYVEIKLCTKDGIIEESITKSQKERYKSARKAVNGDEII